MREWIPREDYLRMYTTGSGVYGVGLAAFLGKFSRIHSFDKS